MMPPKSRYVPKKFGHQSLASGVRIDCETLLNSFIHSGSIKFAEFAKIWRDKNFSLIFCGRQTVMEQMEFIEEVIDIVKRFMFPPFPPFVRVCGLYMFYGVFSKQPIAEFGKLRLTFDEWKELRTFIEEFNKPERLDTYYIFWKLYASQAFHFVATPTPMHPENNTKQSSEPLSCHITTNIGASKEVLTEEPLKSVQKIHDQYVAYKAATQTPTEILKPDGLWAISDDIVEGMAKALSKLSDTRKPEAEVETIGVKRKRLKQKGMGESSLSSAGSSEEEPRAADTESELQAVSEYSRGLVRRKRMKSATKAPRDGTAMKLLELKPISLPPLSEAYRKIQRQDVIEKEKKLRIIRKKKNKNEEEGLEEESTVMQQDSAETEEVTSNDQLNQAHTHVQQQQTMPKLDEFLGISDSSDSLKPKQSSTNKVKKDSAKLTSGKTKSSNLNTKLVNSKTNSVSSETNSPSRKTKSPRKQSSSPGNKTKSPGNDTKSSSKTKSPRNDTKSSGRTKYSSEKTKSTSEKTKSSSEKTKSTSSKVKSLSNKIKPSNKKSKSPSYKTKASPKKRSSASNKTKGVKSKTNVTINKTLKKATNNTNSPRSKTTKQPKGASSKAKASNKQDKSVTRENKTPERVAKKPRVSNKKIQVKKTPDKTKAKSKTDAKKAVKKKTDKQ